MLSFIRFASNTSRAFRGSRSALKLKKMRQDKTTSKLGANPGLDNRLKMLRDEDVDINDDVIHEIIGEESINPYSLGNMHRAYEKEESFNHDRMVRSIVKNKYFPEVQTPNLLTWSEKEHIRYLHQEDPEEWTAEKIAESFPVTLQVARKLLKVDWKPATAMRIERHDASVIRNWKALKEGSLENVTPELREKFMKFSNRVIPPRREQDFLNTIQLTNEKKVFGEYSSIVAPKPEENVPMTIPKLEEKQWNKDHGENLAMVEKYFINKDKHTTLSEMKDNLSTAIKQNKELHPLDQLIAQSTSNDSIAFREVPKTDLSKNFNRKPKSAQVFGDMNDTVQPEAESTYFLRVRIPKSVYKKGSTYKINDCYYDDDGQFLYRVPGLTGQFEN